MHRVNHSAFDMKVHFLDHITKGLEVKYEHKGTKIEVRSAEARQDKVHIWRNYQILMKLQVDYALLNNRVIF